MSLRSSSGLIDPLVHLEDARYVDLESVLQRATNAGVRHLIWGGTQPQDDVQKMCVGYPDSPNIWRAFGYHPAKIKGHEVQSHLDTLSSAIQNKTLVAVGEIGLDARSQMPDMLLQETLFLQQLEMARDADLPVIIHAAKAWGRILLKLKQFGPLPAGGLLHCFGASAELVSEFAKRDLLMSFGGLVTHERAKKMRQAVQEVPLPLLAAESDGPDHPYVNATSPYSEPADLPKIYKHIAALRGEMPGIVAVTVTANLRRVFKKLTA